MKRILLIMLLSRLQITIVVLLVNISGIVRSRLSERRLSEPLQAQRCAAMHHDSAIL